MATNPDAQRAAMAASLHETTGTTLAQWAARAAKHGPDTHGKLVAWLKSQHNLTHGYANLVAHTALRSDAQSQAADGTDLVAAMFMRHGIYESNNPDARGQRERRPSRVFW